jgi:carbonic anhydrase
MSIFSTTSESTRSKKMMTALSTKCPLWMLIALAAMCYGCVVAAGEIPTADEALKCLVEGNKRFVSGPMIRPDQGKARRAELVRGQQPYAIIVTCSDSRIPPELIFDKGFGDLFVVRTAGNVVDDIALGSVEYAAEHLHVPLIIVLGYKGCGAVSAAVKGAEAPGHIAAVVAAIRPAVEKAKGVEGDPVDNTVKANILAVTEKLKSSEPILADLVKEGKLTIIPARYDMETGNVELLK